MPLYSPNAEEVKQFSRSRKTTKTYFLTLYWSLVTFFQVFKMSDTKVIKMELNTLTSRRHELVQKLSKKILKASTVALTSVKGVDEQFQEVCIQAKVIVMKLLDIEQIKEPELG